MKKARIVAVAAAVAVALAATGALSTARAFSGGGGYVPFNGGTINAGLTNNGGTSQTGSLVINGIGQPSAPTVTPITTGTTTATYYCVALDGNGAGTLQGGGGPYLTGGIGNTIPSSGTTITNGAATPNTTIKCAGMTGALGFLVLKNSTSNSFLGSCLTMVSGNSCTVTDSGQALTGYTASTDDGTALLYSPNASINGNRNSNLVQLYLGHHASDSSGDGGITFAGNNAPADITIRNEDGAGLAMSSPTGVGFTVNGADIGTANGAALDLVPTTVAGLSSVGCAANVPGRIVKVKDNDAACVMNAAPAHSTCTVGTNCYSCMVQCATTGGSAYSWVIF